MNTTILFYIGVVILGLLSIQDFRDKVVRRGFTLQYYTCAVLFISFNVLIYMVICSYAMNLSYDKLLLGGENTGDVKLQLLPIGLAFASFGLGSANIPWGNKAVSVYGLLLGVFQGMFRIKEVDLVPIQQEIKSLDKESTQLVEVVDNFVEEGQSSKWDTLKEQWQDMTQEKEDTEKHIDSLTEVREKLNEDDLTDEKKAKISEWANARINQMAKEINNKLRKHIANLVVANNKNQAALDKLLTSIGVPMPVVPSKRSAISIDRALVISLFAGLLLGTFLSGTVEIVEDVPKYMLSWMLGVGLFGGLLSLTGRLRNKSDFCWSLALGGVAGAVGLMGFAVARIALGLSYGDISELKNILDLLPQLIIGALFGACIGLLLHIFRYYVRPRLKSRFACYISIAMAGALLFIILGLIFTGENGDSLINRIMLLSIVGFSVAITVALVTNIFDIDITD